MVSQGTTASTTTTATSTPRASRKGGNRKSKSARAGRVQYENILF